MSIEARVRELELELPTPSPQGNYVLGQVANGLLYMSGQGPVRTDGSIVSGVVGVDLTVEQGSEAARLATLNLLGAARVVMGSLDALTGVVQVLGLVRSDGAFQEHPRVINGSSDLLVEVFGEDGKHARAAVGAASLPFGMCVEITAVFRLRQ